ncbi:hypothetical protein [Noviherbaspirillum pedocola]|uniref:Uncharacterized protein n=1 Tax=Noviherbaspirillum pedocola TaxID=2801341 RepID=A0A934SYD3_9BURK|nr:hypothetical protein [Noviherbaspirillum pedocola]MBK4738007.1 hypothetical protein [Noviherbaspirillum pedocola]
MNFGNKTLRSRGAQLLILIAILTLAYTSVEFVFSIKDAILHERRYQAETKDLIEKLYRQLKKNSICKDHKSDCLDKELIFGQSYNEGITLEFYSMNNKLMAELLAICLDKYIESNREIEIAIYIHEETKQERVHKFLWQLPSPSLIKLERKK